MYNIFENEHGVVIVENEKGEQFIPSCGKDLLAAYQFESTRAFRSQEENERVAQLLLEEVFMGKKPITEMIKRASTPVITPVI